MVVTWLGDALKHRMPADRDHKDHIAEPAATSPLGSVSGAPTAAAVFIV